MAGFLGDMADKIGLVHRNFFCDRLRFVCFLTQAQYRPPEIAVRARTGFGRPRGGPAQPGIAPSDGVQGARRRHSPTPEGDRLDIRKESAPDGLIVTMMRPSEILWGLRTVTRNYLK